MLYGNINVQEIILKEVHRFEKQKDVQVVFGAMVGSISKGMERYDSDYDTRFLYLDKNLDFEMLEFNVDIMESQVHQSLIPDKDGLFYDKVAFWEFSTFVNFLRRPVLDKKYSIGLYHIVPWTFMSPYNWDPYGIVGKIMPLIYEMYNENYEIAYYRDYIMNCLSKKAVLLREYIYSAYYGLAIEYCMRYHKFAPIYFPTLLNFCDDNELKKAIIELTNKYDYVTYKAVSNSSNCYVRKMTNCIETENSEIIDAFLHSILSKSQNFHPDFESSGIEKNYVRDILDILYSSMNPRRVKGVND